MVTPQRFQGPLRFARFIFPLFVLAVTGCVRTQVVNEVTSIVPEAPFRRVLACSFTNSFDGNVRLENLLVNRLQRHRILAESCDTVLTSTMTVEESLVFIQARYGAILIVRREPRPHPAPNEKDGIQSVLLAPKTTLRPTRAERNEDRPKPTTVEQFINFFYRNRHENPSALANVAKTSEETIVQPYGEERYIYGASDLLSTKEDRLVWSLGGYIAGSKDQSLNRFMKVLAKRLEHELDDYGLIP